MYTKKITPMNFKKKAKQIENFKRKKATQRQP